jgi:hypothetical protein
MTVHAIHANPKTGEVVDFPAKDYGSFEGNPVEGIVTFITGSTDLAVDDELAIGDAVQMLVTVRIRRVVYEVDGDGNFVRRQYGKVIDAKIEPFDPSDPNDTGIVKGVR